MFKIVAVVFAAILALAFAAPKAAPAPKPGAVLYNAPLTYAAPLSYSSSYAYSAPAYAAPIVSTYNALPLAYAAPSYYY
ncbi:hypothetical protein ABEB36_001284 [Hypothenemus hampei]|uniref:Neuropeptide-like 4 n=1 Tax=Hypothenemus hampei TaxID=57062 RepID=A0ABD1FE12_HYPHA